MTALSSISLEFEAIGTLWKIDFQASATQAQNLAKQIADLISEFDHNYSRFLPDSWVSVAGKNPGAHKVPTDFEPLYKFYVQMYKATNGLVTPLIGDAMERAGYDAKYSLRPRPMEQIPKLEDILEFKNYTLHVKYICTLDFGAAGKGYLVDLVGNLLNKQGIENYLIDAGGDILHHSPASSKSTPVIQEIGLENPDDPSNTIGTARLTVAGSAICGSAGNRRIWQGFNHIIDPISLTSVTTVKASWVVAETAMQADGLATCLFFIDPKELIAFPWGFDFEYIRILEDNKAQISPKFPGKLFARS